MLFKGVCEEPFEATPSPCFLAAERRTTHYSFVSCLATRVLFLLQVGWSVAATSFNSSASDQHWCLFVSVVITGCLERCICKEAAVDLLDCPGAYTELLTPRV